MFITSKNKYLSNDMKIFGTCSIPLNVEKCEVVMATSRYTGLVYTEWLFYLRGRVLKLSKIRFVVPHSYTY